MSEKKSYSTFKRDELFDQLLNSVEENLQGSSKEGFCQDLPLWLTVGDTWNKKRALKLSEAEVFNLTRPRRTDEKPRLIHLGASREWAMASENWLRMIPEAKELLLSSAREHNDGEFLRFIKRFDL